MRGLSNERDATGGGVLSLRMDSPETVTRRQAPCGRGDELAG